MLENWSFIITGDLHKSPYVHEIVNETIHNNVDLVLFTGDLIDGKTDQSEMENQFKKWQNHIRPLYNAGIGIFPIRGNHDVGKNDLFGLNTTAWNNVFSNKINNNPKYDILPQNGPEDEKNLTYSFYHKNSLMIGLDQFSHVDKTRINLEWLKKILNKNDYNVNPHVFIFSHKPIFSGKDLGHVFQGDPRERDAFCDLIIERKVSIYFCGHAHFYLRAFIKHKVEKNNNGVWQVINGTYGKNSYRHKFSGIFDTNGSNFNITPSSYSTKISYTLVEILNGKTTITNMVRNFVGRYKKMDQWSYASV